ncbi:MAG: 16S rRNA (guanine(527)-N(7))-methyltransferase RsmG [Dysgonamonadaceae bacterium]|jgi:16S rRNA (guanine527-N7)-methyltransferase|nr:16S rRNA (guanine(527)-N(7))-methyltransferase RsmG [Dysgonamonadaceae bacterium]
MSAEPVKKYFPQLSQQQQTQFDALFDLYKDWNGKINVISRKDIDNLYVHHVLHSLGIAKYLRFVPDSLVMDVGTGGGFPGIPLAIFFPEVQFLLLDSIRKKIRVGEEVAQAIGLENVEFVHSRVEDEKRKFDFVVSRAVMPLPDLVKVTRKNISDKQRNAIPNGIICLKGGNLDAEIHPFASIIERYPLSNYFDEPFFDSKQIVYMPIH